MYFFIASFIIMISASLITIRVLTAYSHFPISINAFTACLVVLGWSAPLIIGLVRRYNLLEGEAFNYFHWLAYALFGFVFILFCLLMARDFLWFAGYKIAHLGNFVRPWMNPKAETSLNIANLFTLIIALLLSVYALYEGMKTPRLVEVTLQSPKINTPTDIVILSDFHVDRTTPVKRIKQLSSRIKGLRPDVVLIAGDLVDDRVSAMGEQIEALKQIKAKYGTYLVLGNHEFYSGLSQWLPTFQRLNYRLLYNDGASIPSLNLYIGGIPDVNTTRFSNSIMRPNLYGTMRHSRPEEYKILLTHNPSYVKDIYKGAVDLAVSGHTHGGQIFPFHFLSKHANQFLSGMYDVKDMKLYVSNGYGYWGPSMRLFAPSELVLLHLEPQK